MRRLHSLALRVVLQARSLSAALRAGTGAEKRVATGLFDSGRVGPVGWCDSLSGPVGVVWVAGRVWGLGWRTGWGCGQGGVASRVGGWVGGPGGGWVGPGGGGWGGGPDGGGPGRVLAGLMRRCGYIRLFSPKQCLYG